MPISFGSGNAGTPQLIQIRPPQDGDGWEITLDVLWGTLDAQTREFEPVRREVVQYTGADVPGLTNQEKGVLAALLGKLMTGAATAKGMTNPKRTGRFWHE